MLFLLQLALGIAFLGYLILAFFDAIRGIGIILTGLVLLAAGYTLKLASFILRRIHPARATVAPPLVTRRGATWQILAPKKGTTKDLDIAPTKELRQMTFTIRENSATNFADDR